MYSSPATPGGVGWRLASSTNTCVLAIGRPIGTRVSADATRWMVDQMVVSVGPYMFHSSAHRGSSARTRSGGRASPPHRIFRLGEPLHPAATSARHSAGVACITVQADSRIRSIRRAGSRVSSRLAIATRPPLTSGRNSSRPAISKDSVVTARIVSAAVNPGVRCIDSRKFTTAEWGISTPLGLPVEPDV